MARMRRTWPASGRSCLAPRSSRSSSPRRPRRSDSSPNTTRPTPRPHHRDARQPRGRKEAHVSDKQVVLAIFPDEAAADAAVEALKVWSKSEDEKLDAIGILCLDEQGHVKDHKLGKK